MLWLPPARCLSESKNTKAMANELPKVLAKHGANENGIAKAVAALRNEVKPTGVKLPEQMVAALEQWEKGERPALPALPAAVEGERPALPAEGEPEAGAPSLLPPATSGLSTPSQSIPE